MYKGTCFSCLKKHATNLVDPENQPGPGGVGGDEGSEHIVVSDIWGSCTFMQP